MKDGYATVRDARQDDAKELAELFANSWHGAYVGIIPDIDIRRMIASRSRKYWQKFLRHSDGLLVIEAGGRIAGYATIGPARTRGDFEGEIYEFYVAPLYQGLGLGEILFEAARTRLEAAGKRGLIVWALADNDRAQSFYMGRGGIPRAETRQKFTGKHLTKTAYAFN